MGASKLPIKITEVQPPIWLQQPHMQKLFGLFSQNGIEARVVGGAVRDHICNLNVKDIDMGCTLEPDLLQKLLTLHGVRNLPTGKAFGTITAIFGDEQVQITTLRADFDQDGRHTKVRFSHNWAEDAKRRDFTLNTLSMDRNGVIYDYVGGYQDLLEKTVKFVGRPEKRIQEDYLRIIRFFRFTASYGGGKVHEPSAKACQELRNGLGFISSERKLLECEKIATSVNAGNCWDLLIKYNVTSHVLGNADEVSTIEPFFELYNKITLGGTPSLTLQLLLNIPLEQSAVAELCNVLRFSKAQRQQVRDTFKVACLLIKDSQQSNIKNILYRFGNECFRDGLFLSFAKKSLPAGMALDILRNIYEFAESWNIPRNPFVAAHFMSKGVSTGPILGKMLSRSEELWRERDYPLEGEAHERIVSQVLKEFNHPNC